VQYVIDGDGTPEDVQFAAQVEDRLNDVLGWTGLGHCDGNDISDGTMNIYCYVVDPRLSLEPMVQELKENDLLRAAVVAFQDKDEHFVVLWPENWQGEFSY